STRSRASFAIRCPTSIRAASPIRTPSTSPPTSLPSLGRSFRSKSATISPARFRLMRCTIRRAVRPATAVRRLTISSRLVESMRLLAAGFVAVTLAAAGVHAQFQRRGRGGFGYYGPRVQENPKYDGAFQFCRISFRNASNGDGAGWYVDYPRADENLTFRLS